MYRRLSAIMFPILAIALIGTGVWGYQEHQEKNSILIKAENQYQRAFHDLSYYMGQLKQELGKTMAVNSASQDYQKRHLIQVWRTTSQAQSQINQLPLTLLPFTKTEEFLDKIANFSYRTSIRDLKNEPLSDSENKTLLTLYSRSKELSKELESIQTEVFNQNLRWMDVELAIAEQTSGSNAVVDGFKSMDHAVSEYDEVDWGPSVNNIYKKQTVFAQSGKVMSEYEVREKASTLIEDVQPDQWMVTENGKGTDYNSYSLSIVKEDGNVLNMDYTKRGGHLLWYINPREVKQENLTLAQARDRAAEFLKQHQYESLTPVNYDHYDKVTSITFAATEGDIVYYPRKISVRVAMDNGEVVGVQAQNYMNVATKKLLDKPKMTKDEAIKLLNPTFEQTSSNLSYIESELNEEVLCYEFTGKINGGHYRIFMNANTGAEEKIETIEPLEAAFGHERG